MEPPVLVVDPDPAVAGLLRRHLEMYEVVQVKNINRLAEAVNQHHPRAVILNGPADGSNGHKPSIALPAPVIECSLPSLTQVAENLAVAACLNKPVTSGQLLKEIEQFDAVREVLVVDDEQGFCQLVKQILESTGRTFTVRAAHNGGDGLQAMRSRPPDLVLLDLSMPGLNGFEVLDQMRQEAQLAGIPVILLTATSFTEDAQAQSNSQLVVSRQDGLHLNELLQALQAIIGVLEPHYDEPASVRSTQAARPPLTGGGPPRPHPG
jgi:CheY-like chemotaxis protein